MKDGRLVIHLGPAASLSGTIYLDGSPAANVLVTLATQPDAKLEQTQAGSQRTDEQGAYRWDNLDPAITS